MVEEVRPKLIKFELKDYLVDDGSKKKQQYLRPSLQTPQRKIEEMSI